MGRDNTQTTPSAQIRRCIMGIIMKRQEEEPGDSMVNSGNKK